MKQTTLCYIDDGENYLMLHRVKKKNDASHDKWIGVGGKFEENESPEECMLREVKEETGLTITQWRYCGIVTFVSDVWPAEYMHLFLATAWQGAVGDCDEGVLQWIPKSQVLALPTWEGDRIFLQRILKGSDFFSLKLVYRGDDLAEATIDGKRFR